MSLPDSTPSDDERLSVQPFDGICDTETAITEITFLPDGRLCLFGASREVLELLGSLDLGDASLDSRLAAACLAATEFPRE